MTRRGAAPDRRRGAANLGAHPERRILAPARRAILRRRRAAARPRLRAVVLPPVVNMFEKPDASSSVVSQATLGTTVAILEAARGFDLAETPDRYRGWIRSVALRPLPGHGTSYPRPGRAFRVRNFVCQVYAEKDVTSASPISVAPLLSPVEVSRDAGEWKRVRLPDGRTGWVQSGDLEPAGAAVPPGPGDPAPAGTSPAALDGEGLAATALRFLGLPYLWGGTTPFGLDCSGLVQLVCRLHGRLLPRDADQQFAGAHQGPVDRAGLRAGDLVFFGPDEESITHVGIALGRDAFVSATTYRSPIVRVDRLDDPYWSGLYRGARRLRAGA